MFSKVLTASPLSRISDEDLCSQLNYLWTAFIIAAMGTLITAVQYVGNPIYCWCPAEMPQVQCNYTMALCWVKENYYVSEKEVIKLEEKDRYGLSVSYYPWVPWILFFMSAMLNLPHIIWRSFASSSGLNLSKLVTLADSHDSFNNLAKILRIWLVKTNSKDKSMVSTAKAFLGSLGIFRLGKHHRTYLCGLLLLVKLLYLFVSVGLHVGLNIFIDESFLSYGYEMLDNFLKGIPQNSARFPKETICDIKIRQMSNVHTYSIQCILPINLYNETIFIFLWFWFLILIGFNSYSLIKWAFNLLSFARRRSFVKGYVIILFHLLEKKKSGSRDNSRNPVFHGHEKNGVVVNQEQDKQGTVSADEPRQQMVMSTRTKGSGMRLISNLIMPKYDRRRHSLRSSIETTEHEIVNKKRMQNINRITSKMLKHFGHDGTVVFRTLEDAVGIVIANEIFQELYEQLNYENHYR